MWLLLLGLLFTNQDHLHQWRPGCGYEDCQCGDGYLQHCWFCGYWQTATP